ncbi:MAG: CapA family protein [Kiritimatiellae bacterium]|nr:CapA family protein [Kiritimatiellia bacterium]
MKTGEVQRPRVCCLGDTVPIGRAEAEIRRLGGPAAAGRLWNPAGPADVIFLNLEAAVCRASVPRADKRYNLRADPAVLEAFDPRVIAGLANNHVMDFGEAGLAETLEQLDARGLRHVGAGRNLDEARRPALVDVRGLPLAFLAAADPRFSPATDRSPGTFPAIPELLAESIAEACREGRTVIVAVHAGMEFSSVPFPATVRLADRCLDAGARLVVFHHAHCPSGIRQDERGLVLFGTGKHVFSAGDFAGGRRLKARLLRPARRSAAWLVTLPRPSCELHPFVIGEDGLPGEPTEDEARAIRDEVARNSRRLARPLALSAARLQTFLRPAFLGLNAEAYRDMLRRHGLRRMWAALREGVRAQGAGERVLPVLRRLLFWLLPILILAFIFRRIDWPMFRVNFSRAAPGLVLLGLLYYPLVILVGALRWRLLLNQFDRARVGFGFALKHYWIGLALGLFGPASIGWDAYRLVAAGRRLGRYAPGAAAIATEKLLALVTCAGLVVGLYPLVPIETGPAARAVLTTACALLGAAGLLFLVLVLARRRLDRLVGALAARLLRRAPGAEPASLIEPVTSWRLLRGTLALSLANLLIAALGNQIFFRAVGWPIPFLANLFVLPVLMFVFLLPISFGSLGIREGAYILLYGLFGVPPETALLVSFFNLAGLLFNTLIGGIVVAMHGTLRKTEARPA